jgi:hypothetical protein
MTLLAGLVRQVFAEPPLQLNFDSIRAQGLS